MRSRTRLLSAEALLPHPQRAAGCSSSRGIKAKKCRIFGFFCLCPRRIQQDFPSAAAHAQPCPDLTPASPPGPPGKVPMGARPWGAGMGRVLGALGAPNPPRTLSLLLWGCTEGWEGTQGPRGCFWGESSSHGRRGGKVGSWEPTLARGQQWPCGVMCSWILFKSGRREDSSEHWINSTFSLSLSLFLLGK